MQLYFQKHNHNKFNSDYNRTSWILCNPFYVQPAEIRLDLFDVEPVHIQELQQQITTTSTNKSDKDNDDDDVDDDDEKLSKDELFAKYAYVLKGKNATFQYIPILKMIL